MCLRMPWSKQEIFVVIRYEPKAKPSAFFFLSGLE